MSVVSLFLIVKPSAMFRSGKKKMPLGEEFISYQRSIQDMDIEKILICSKKKVLP
jgi:hypothetical protein